MNALERAHAGGASPSGAELLSVSASAGAASPIADALIWVNHPRLMLERAAGLTVIERQLFLLKRAGIRRVWVAADKPEAALRVPPGLALEWVPREGDGPVECRTPYLGVSGDHFVKKEALAEVLGRAHPRHVSYQDEDGRSVLQVIAFRGERVLQFEKRPLPPGSCLRLSYPLERRAALPWLLDTARKGHDGLMARVFDRRISLAATRWLLDTPVKPNHMTLFSSGVGVLGACLFAVPGLSVAGALIVWLHSVLDGCDGELARLRFQESKFGGILDFWGDNVVHMALFSAIGIGVYRAGAGPWALWLGGVAAAASLAAAALTFWHSIKRQRESAPLFNGVAIVDKAAGTAATLQKVEDMLAQRDFIYLLVAIAFFGLEKWFLIAGAVGTPIFLAILIYLTFVSGATPDAVGQQPSRGNTR